jgi:thiamine kinase-like enzyme
MIHSVLLSLFILLCSCSRPQIDEKSAAELVKKTLAFKSGNISSKKLKGAGSGASLFLVSQGEKKFIVKYIKSKRERQQEIYNSKIASDAGYGPKVFFADPSQGILVMEFLPGIITLKEIENEPLYIALAHLLQKIHEGPSFVSTYDVLKKIEKNIKIKKPKYPNIPIEKMEKIFLEIQKALSSHMTKTPCHNPCHNDLYYENVRYFENECKAIDFGNAGEGDPYLDVASILNSMDVGSDSSSHEKVLFSTYLRHPPSSLENAKLYLMKQIVLIRWIFDRLDALKEENVKLFDTIEKESFQTVRRKMVQGEIDVRKPEGSLQFLNGLIDELFTNSESQEFKNAVTVLSNDCSLG